MTTEALTPGVHEATITITGGTGSFGTTMARHLLTQDVKAINILSRDEAKQDQMRRDLGDERLRFFLGDVRDPHSCVDAVRGADFVFHAAALKQVPSCEFFPDQAVLTNVNGSDNLIRAAIEAGVRSVVCLSTDKAVYPINAMGMTKALMEKTAQAAARKQADRDTTISITRYGNVMMSRGSVIPLFLQQLTSGAPLTITEPMMTRFLMSLEDSVSLVYHAFHHAKPGDLFVRKAPACTILTLAEATRKMAGRPDHPIRIIGTRHGEKLHETLLSREESAGAVSQGAYFRVPMDARSLDYEAYFDRGEEGVAQHHDYTSESTEQLDLEGTIALLKSVKEIANHPIMEKQA